MQRNYRGPNPYNAHLMTNQEEMGQNDFKIDQKS